MYTMSARAYFQVLVGLSCFLFYSCLLSNIQKIETSHPIDYQSCRVPIFLEKLPQNFVTKNVHNYKSNKSLKDCIYPSGELYYSGGKYYKRLLKPVFLCEMPDRPNSFDDHVWVQPVTRYKLPYWPFPSLFNKLRYFFQVQLNLNTASQSFSSRGKSSDIAEIIFSRLNAPCASACSNIFIRDILLVSRLAEQGKVGLSCSPDVNEGHPDTPDLAALAGQPVIFNGSTTSIGTSLNFSHRFFGDDWAFGCQLPIIYRENKLELCNRLDPLIEARLNSNGRFKHKSLNQIMCMILDAKGTKLDRSRSEVSVGDITAFLRYEIKCRYVQRLFVGLSASVPTSCELDNHTLWDPRLGGSFFTRLNIFSSAMWSLSRVFNPHVRLQATYSFPSHMQRRVPEKVIFDGRTEADDAARRNNRIPDDLMVLAENVFLLDSEKFGKDTSFCEFDARVRHFSDKITSFKINPGPELYLRIGNVIERLFCDRLFLDMYYDLRFKGRNYLGSRKVCDNFDPRIWSQKTDEIAHRFGGVLSYQCGSQIRVGAGVSYTFEGRNVPKAFDIHVDCNIEF